MKLSQINVGYVEVEDRLLLRINTDERAEFRFWLTRRVAESLLSGIERAAAGVPAREDWTGTAEALQATRHVRRQEASEQADFSEAYRADAADFPLGQHPVLIAEASLLPSRPHVSLVLRLVDGRNLNIALDDSLSHGLATAIRDIATRVAAWQSAFLPVPGSAPVSLVTAASETRH